MKHPGYIPCMSIYAAEASGIGTWQNGSYAFIGSKVGGISVLSDPYITRSAFFFSGGGGVYMVVSGKLFFLATGWLEDHCNDCVVIGSERIFNAPFWWFMLLVVPFHICHAVAGQ